MGFLWSIEVSKKIVIPMTFNLRLPPFRLLGPGNSLEAWRVVPCQAHVATVLCSRG